MCVEALWLYTGPQAPSSKPPPPPHAHTRKIMGLGLPQGTNPNVFCVRIILTKSLLFINVDWLLNALPDIGLIRGRTPHFTQYT